MGWGAHIVQRGQVFNDEETIVNKRNDELEILSFFYFQLVLFVRAYNGEEILRKLLKL